MPPKRRIQKAEPSESPKIKRPRGRPPKRRVENLPGPSSAPEEAPEEPESSNDPEDRWDSEYVPPRRAEAPESSDPPSEFQRCGFTQTVHIHRDPFRPVPFKLQPKPQIPTPEELRKPKTRITRRICFSAVQQFQDSEDARNLANVEVKTAGETVMAYLEASRIFQHPSENFFDEFIPVAMEHNDRIAIFNFGSDLKKHGVKNKIHMFQESWANKKKHSGTFPVAENPKIDHLSDGNLFEQHSLTQRSTSRLQMLNKKFRKVLNLRRTDDSIIRDSSFFVREFYLTKSSMNLHISRSVDIPVCEVPPVMKCGYFPLSATTNSDKMMYLAARYQEAQLEYLNLTTRSILPPEGFEVDSITARELLNFHEIGHHIHGFYTVWKVVGDDDEVENEEGIMVKKRYLVDFFNFMKFPLYAKFERWDARIKATFDVNTTYLLHLTEIIRCNAPVFFRIHPDALHNPVTLREMTESIANRHTSVKCFAEIRGLKQLYEDSLANISAETLSAYFMIVGGSKKMKSSESPRIQKPFEFYPITEEHFIFLDRDGAQLKVESDVSIQKIFSRNPGFEDFDKDPIKINKIFRTSNPPFTHVITDVQKDQIQKASPQEFVVLPRRSEVTRIRRRRCQEPTPRRKKPGRKPRDPMKKLLERHGFREGGIVEEDYESDLEGFTYTDDHIPHTTRPQLHRSTSSESIFLSSTYTDYPIDRLSMFHECQFPRNPKSFKEKKARKLGEMAQRRIVQAKMVMARNRAESELMDCLEGKMPNLMMEVRKKTEGLFTRADNLLINDCAFTLKSMISQLVAVDLAQIQVSNTLTTTRQSAIDSRILEIQKLPGIQKTLPSPQYLAIEWLADTKIQNPRMFEKAKRSLRNLVIRSDKKMEPMMHRVVHLEPRRVDLNQKMLVELREGVKKKQVRRSRDSEARIQMAILLELLDEEQEPQEPIVEEPQEPTTSTRTPFSIEEILKEPRHLNPEEPLLEQMEHQKHQEQEHLEHLEPTQLQNPDQALLEERIREERILREAEEQIRLEKVENERRMEQSQQLPLLKPIPKNQKVLKVQKMAQKRKMTPEPLAIGQASPPTSGVLKTPAPRASGHGQAGNQVPRFAQPSAAPPRAPAPTASTLSAPGQAGNQTPPAPPPPSEAPAYGQDNRRAHSQVPPAPQPSASPSVSPAPAARRTQRQAGSQVPAPSPVLKPPAPRAPGHGKTGSQASSAIAQPSAAPPRASTSSSAPKTPAQSQADNHSEGQSSARRALTRGLSASAPVNGPEAPGHAPRQTPAPKTPATPGHGQASAPSSVSPASAARQAQRQAGSQVPLPSPVLKAPVPAAPTLSAPGHGQVGNQSSSAPPLPSAPKGLAPRAPPDGQDCPAGSRDHAQVPPALSSASPSAQASTLENPAQPAPVQALSHGQTGSAPASSPGQTSASSLNQGPPTFPSSQASPSASVPEPPVNPVEPELAPVEPVNPVEPLESTSEEPASSSTTAAPVEPGPVEQAPEEPKPAGQASTSAEPVEPPARGQAGSQVQGPAPPAPSHGFAPGKAQNPAPPSPPPSHWIPSTPPELLNCFWTSISAIEDPKQPAGWKGVSEIAIPALLAEQSKIENRKENMRNSVKILMMIGYLHCKKTPMTRMEPFLKLDGIPEAEEIKGMILEASTWIELAGKEQMAELRSYVNWNGFPRIGDQFKKIKDKILELVKVKNVRDQAVGKSDEEIFLEVVAVLKISLEREMGASYGLQMSLSEHETIMDWARGNHEFVGKMKRGEVEDLAVEEQGFDIMMTWFRKLNG